VVPSQFPSGTTIRAAYDYHGYYPEGASLIRWYKNDRYQNRYDDQRSFVAIGEVDDTWFFTVTPSDGYHYGDTVRSSPGVIVSVEEAALSVEIVPHNPQVTDNLYLSINGKVRPTSMSRYDVKWYKNGSELVGYRNKYVVPYTEVFEGDVFSVVVEEHAP